MAQKYISREGQTIFDIGLMLNGTLETIVKFAMDNGIISLTDKIPAGTIFYYEDSGLALTNWIKKNGYIFTTANQSATVSESGFLLQENGSFILQENGFKLTL